MKKNVWIFGLILGTILAGHSLYMLNKVYHDTGFEGNDVIGYAAMIIVYSLTFFGIRNYRDKELNGIISLGKAFKTGALIALVGSTMYVIVGLFYIYQVAPDFLDKYSEHVVKIAAKHGATPAELTAKAEQMATFKEMYSNPLFGVLIAYVEVLPIGLLVAFVSALILKKKPTQ